MAEYGDAISSALGFAGSLFSSRMRYKAANRLLDKQLAWSERMANTSHQREVADLRAAGLNPVLSAMGGSGATTPSAGTANMPDIENPMNSALAWRQQRNENKLADAEVDNKKADSYLKGNQANTESENFNNAVKTGQLIEAQTAKQLNDIENDNKRLQQEISESNSRIENNNSNSAYSRAQAERENYRNKKEKADSDFYGSNAGRRLRQNVLLQKSLPFGSKVYD